MNDEPNSTLTSKSTQEGENNVTSMTLSGSNALPESNMELVHGQNPWLPAYGFQIQHHSQFQPTHEDLRANDTVLVQQVDFLETILEETSDDLQSDSDRSGTTYWLGSDSETESVVHIRANQVAADDRLEGSDSECNSVVPKKRRRKNGVDERLENGVAYGDDLLTSPKLSRSSGSSRSSSLLQFESLERTCATLSPSSYSFDSLEYSNRSNSHFENTSPDSLEQDYDHRLVPNSLSGSSDKVVDTFVGKIRPYRSLESLDTCQKEENARQRLSNGFSSLYSDRKYDLSSRTRRVDDHRRDFWHNDDDYNDDDDDDYYEEVEEDPEDVEDDDNALSRYDRFEERLVFRDVNTSNYATSLDCRNTIDLREIGIETKRDAVHDLKSGQAGTTSSLLQSRLNIASNIARSVGQQGWSKKPRFNYRFTDKSQSAPSLASIVRESGLVDSDDYTTSTTSTTSGINARSGLGHGFEYYTRVSSVPIELDLCGTFPQEDHAPSTGTTDSRKRLTTMLEEEHEMADAVAIQDDAIATSVRTQDPRRDQRVLLERQEEVEEAEAKVTEKKMKREKCPARQQQQQQQQQQLVTSTVKTQDRSGGTLEIAMAMEDGDIDAVVDEAIKQFKREVEEATAEAVQRPSQVSSGRGGRRSVRNNASYELAQQFEINERSLMGMPSCAEIESEDSPKPAPRRRVLNNASYELAQQCDYIKALQTIRPFQRMDACDELEEPSAGSSSRYLKVSELVEEMSKGLCSTSVTSRSACDLVAGEHGKEELSSSARTYSKSTENVSTNVDGGRQRTGVLENRRGTKNLKNGGGPTVVGKAQPQLEQESLLSQIKKNSDLFSMYGGGANPSALDDEVDFPYLENKPIETRVEKGILDSDDRNGWAKVIEGRDEEGDDDDDDDEVGKEIVAIEDSERWNGHEENPQVVSTTLKNPIINGTSLYSTLVPAARSSSPSRMSFLSEFYSEISARQDRSTIDRSPPRSNRRHVDRAEISGDQAVPVWNTDGPRSSIGAVAVDELVEVAITTMAEKEEEKEEKEKEEAVGMEGHNVDSVYGPPPDPTESQRRSGNGAVVDTNRVDNKNYDDTTVREGMSTSTKRDAVVDTTMTTTTTRKKGLGGFLQRFSKLRFSGRSKVPRSEVHKKSDAQVNRAKVQTKVATVDTITTTKKNKEPDYIIIPLHPPKKEEEEEEKYRRKEQEAERKNEVVTVERNAETIRKPVDLDRSGSNVSSTWRAPVSSKPPLPPQPPRAAALGSRPTSGVATRRRAATDLGSPAAIEMAKARTMQAGSERPVGLLETDLDADEGVATPATSAGAAGKKTRSLLNLNHTRIGRDAGESALHASPSPGGRTPDDASVGSINQRPHKSMEFLLDKENLHFVKPPENELQKVGERVPSEHELRVQRSLQRLNVPDWYRNSPAARDGFRLKRHSDASQHGGWRALGSKTTSLSSLSSSSNRQPTSGVLLSPSPTPPVFSRWSTSLLNSAGSSPASSARSSFNHRQPYLGWRSQERLANPRTPAERLAQGILPQLQSANKQQQQTTNQQLEVRNSIKEVTSAIVHYVQSGQEVGGGGRLSPRPRPDDWDDRGGARSTSPRGSVKLCWMESSFVGSRPVDSPETPMSLATEAECCTGCDVTVTESCSCVDSVTSGLYLDLTPTQEGTSLCPSSSPSYDHQHQHYQHHHHHRHHNHHHHHHHHHQPQQQQQQRHRRGSDNSDTEEAMAAAALLRNKPSPGSTTLEDVLDSLLGLPSASRTPSPGPGSVSGFTSVRQQSNVNVNASTNAGKSCSELRQDLQESAKTTVGAVGPEDRPSYYVGELVRRKSEGSDTTTARVTTRIATNLRNRRVSFDNVQENGSIVDKTVRCRNNKCNKVATAYEARRSYKSCHNCTCLYCSRECRRAHWQRHRRTCLHSRAGTLCRQVLSAAKEDPSSLRHISALAKRGHASHGRGTVKCFFSSPEAAEKFVTNGFVDLGEPTYVRWSDLLPSEMGAELYAEVMRLCKSYNPDTRLVLYVAVCVVSEVPTSGAVKWERQLVSRCAKIRLDSSFRQSTSMSVLTTTSITVTTTTTTTTMSIAPTITQQQQSQTGRQTSASPCNITRDMDSPETLVLTSFPGSNGQNTPQRAREISFTNIQRQLRLRGVSLRRHFPQVYKKLCSYVDGSVDKFAPVTIYPRDQASGKSFMCIIMLDAEPERLQLLPTDSSRVRTVDISIEQD